MKFIVKTDFYRTPELADVKIVGACKGASIKPPHANHIHQGAIIELGAAANEAELQKSKTSPEKILIAQLRYCGRIGDAADAEVVARVEREVEAQAKREAAREKAIKHADSAAVGDLFTALAALAQKPNSAPH